ncbi:MAG: glycosyltransferase family 1 protein [Chloroflexi bacterium]|nr:glycosyltransferase family 1 protein [Chloroflexota bacterium]
MRSEPMRIALFTETFLPKIDGIVTVVCLLLDHLAARGIAATVVAPKMGVTRYGHADVIGVPGVRFPFYPELRIGPSTPATYRRLRRFQPDLVHLFHPVLIGLPGMLMAKRLGIPILTSFHLDVARLAGHYGLGFLEPGIDWATRVVFNWADYALAPSQRVQAELHALGVREVGWWRRGVDAARFNPRHRSDSMRAALSGGHPDDVLLLYVGRISAEKQLDQLRPVLDQVPGTRLALVGEGPARADLEARFAGTPTTFMGYLTGAALAEAYASADVFVFPSASEAYGLVVIEAMAAGLPVVASRVGGVNDMITEGVNGYTFAVNDQRGLIDGVRQIASNRARISAMGRAARAFAETQTWDASLNDLVDLYAALIAAKAARRVTA